MAEDNYAGIIKNNLRKLSEIGGGIDELSSMERPLRRLGEHEVAIQSLAKMLEDAANEIKSDLDEQRAYFEGKIDDYLQVVKEAVTELSEIDATLIDKVSKIEDILVGKIDESGTLADDLAR